MLPECCCDVVAYVSLHGLARAAACAVPRPVHMGAVLVLNLTNINLKQNAPKLHDRHKHVETSFCSPCVYTAAASCHTAIIAHASGFDFCSHVVCTCARRCVGEMGEFAWTVLSFWVRAVMCDHALCMPRSIEGHSKHVPFEHEHMP